MIQILGALLTVIAVSGLCLIIEGATGAWRWLNAWVRSRLRPSAPPHANPEPTDEEEDECI